MAGDALQSVLRLRRMAQDAAARTVADCLAAERAAEQRLVAAEQAIARETEAARRSDGDAEVEAFAAWLPVGRRVLLAAEAARTAAGQETERARAALGLARSAVKAAETLLEQRAAAQRQVAERRAQAALDEIGHPSAGPRPSPDETA